MTNREVALKIINSDKELLLIFVEELLNTKTRDQVEELKRIFEIEEECSE
jgi:hypothetical protein